MSAYDAITHLTYLVNFKILLSIDRLHLTGNNGPREKQTIQTIANFNGPNCGLAGSQLYCIK